MKNFKIYFIIAIFFLSLPAFCTEDKYPSFISTGKLKGVIKTEKPKLVNQDWWDSYSDPILSGYISKALNANYDVKIAGLKILEYESLARATFANQLPTLGVGGTYQNRKTSGNMPMGSMNIPSYSQNTYLFPLTMNYELDLWGKNKLSTKSSRKETQMMIYEEETAYITVISAVATSYFNLSMTDKLIEIQKNIITQNEDKLSLLQSRYAQGLIAYDEINQIEENLKENNSELAEFRRQQTLFLNQLAVLTGESTSNTAIFEREVIKNIVSPKNIPTEIPSNVVLARPDVLKAEAQLQKARLDVDVARKDFLPAINITGQVGFYANALSRTFDSSSCIASIGGSLMQSLFTGGKKTAVLKAKKYQYEELLQNYQKTILSSFQEVNDSLASYKNNATQFEEISKKLDLVQDDYNIQKVRYDAGLVSYIDLIGTNEKLLTAQKRLTQTKAAELISTISVYKAIAGNNY